MSFRIHGVRCRCGQPVALPNPFYCHDCLADAEEEATRDRDE